MALWDTRENRLVAETPKTDSAHWLGFAAGDLAMVSVSSGRVGEQDRIPPVDRVGFRFISLSDVKLAAVHPSGASLVVDTAFIASWSSTYQPAGSRIKWQRRSPRRQVVAISKRQEWKRPYANK